MSEKYNQFSKEELITLLNKQDSEFKLLAKQKYGIYWDKEKEPEQVVLECENNLPILERVANKEIKTDDSEDNILIEGDNYHALTVLNYTHKEKIDVIYIDPPYNTGNKDFIYNDKYVDKEDGYRHSKWLNFMEKRLELAKYLLKDTGVIFISIDDNELNNLKLLCDKIFIARNYEATITYVRKTSGKQDSTNFAKSTEYILVYSKNSQWKSNQLEAEDKVTKRYNKIAKNGKFYREVDLRKTGTGDSRLDRPGMWYPFYYNVQTNELRVCRDINSEYHNTKWIEILPNKSDGSEGRWRWGFDTAERKLNNLIAKIMPKYIAQEKWTIYEMDFIDKNEDIRTVKEHTYWDRTEFNSDNAITDFTKLGFSNKDFDFPKSVELMKHILRLSTKKNSFILDFFAGSGTTGQAILELNKEDNGNRKFIICTNDEGGICKNITYPRVKKIINGYNFAGKDKTSLLEKKITCADLMKNAENIADDANELIDNNKDNFDKIEKEFKNNTLSITGINKIEKFKEGLGGNLQYFKTALIPVKKIDKIDDAKRIELTEKAGQMIAIKENTFEEVELNEFYQIFSNKSKSKNVAIYFREDMGKFEELINIVKGIETTLYIFSFGKIEKKIFQYLDDAINIEDIPQPILDIYKEINQTYRKDK